MTGLCRLQPDHLMTRDERRNLRILRSDLERQILRVPDPLRVAELEQQLASVLREQDFDKQVSPRGKRGKRGTQSRRRRGRGR